MNQEKNSNLVNTQNVNQENTEIQPAAQPKAASARKKTPFLIAGLAVVIAAAAAVIAVSALHVDLPEARQKALETVGGNGQIVSETVENEFLFLNEYSFTIQSDNGFYELDLSPFGNVKEMESTTAR